MNLTHSQLEKILDSSMNSHGINKLFEIMLNSLMKIERKFFLEEQTDHKNKGNGLRYVSGIGLNKSLRLAIPRDRLNIYQLKVHQGGNNYY